MQSRIIRYFLYIVIVILPWLVLSVMLFRLRLPLDGMTPAAVPFGPINDGVFYWHQAETFRIAGFDGGIYSVDEMRPTVESIPFYTWGPFIPMLYGSIGRIFGWAFYAIPLTSLIALSLSLLMYIWVIRPTIQGAALLVLFLGTSNMLMLSSMLSTMTILNAVLAVFYATLFVRLFSSQLTLRGWEWVLGMVGLVLGSLILPIWAILFVPYFALLLRGRGWLASIAGLLLGVLCFAGFLILFTLLGAPFPNTASEIITSLRFNFEAGWERILLNIKTNIDNYLRSAPLENWTRGQVILIVIFGLLTAIWLLVRKRVTWCDLRAWEGLFHSYHLGVLYLLFFTIYHQDGYTDYRQFAPRLLLTVLFLVGLRRYGLAALLIMSMLPAVPMAYEPARVNALYHVSSDNNAAIIDWQQRIIDVLVYTSDAPSPWCNTVMMSQYYIFYELQLVTAIPGGIGLSFDFGDLTDPPFRSRYLLMHDDIYVLYASELSVLPLLDVPNGKLYLNLESACPYEDSAR